MSVQRVHTLRAVDGFNRGVGSLHRGSPEALALDLIWLAVSAGIAGTSSVEENRL
jgi:hypothetical protein